MLDILRQKSRTLGVYLVFATLIVIFAVGFGAVSPSTSCGGDAPGSLRVAEYVEVEGETIDTGLVRLASELSGDGPTAREPRPDFRYLSRLADIGLYSAWSGARFARDSESVSPLKMVKVVDDLVEQKLVAAWARSMGMSVSEKELNDSLALLLDNFRDEKTGVFEMKRYRGWTAGLGSSTGAFEALVSDEILRERVIQLLVGEVGATDAEIEAAFRLENDKVTVDFVSIDAKSAAPFVKVTDDEAATWLGANEQKAKDEYDKLKVSKYTTPKTFKLRGIRVDAPDPSVAADDEQKKALEDERKASKEKADKALADFRAKLAEPPVEGEPNGAAPAANDPYAIFADVAKTTSDDASKDSGAVLGDVEVPALGRAPYGPSVASAADALKVGEVTEVLETPTGFWILLPEGVTEEKVTTYDEAKTEIARSLIQAEKGTDLMKSLADEVLAEAKKDPTKKLDDVVAAIHTARGATGLSVRQTSFSRLSRIAEGYPASSPFLFELGGRSPELVSAAFAASAEKPLVDKVLTLDEGKKLLVVRFSELKKADAMTEDQKRDARNTLVWERRRALYRAWYEDLYKRKVEAGDIAYTSDYEEDRKAAEEAFVQAGGKLPGVATATDESSAPAPVVAPVGAPAPAPAPASPN
jgi:hypothetical protein